GIAMRRPQSRTAALGGAALVVTLAAGAVVWRAPDRHSGASAADPVSTTATRATHHHIAFRALASRTVGRLDAPLQDAAAVALGGSRAMLLGGLTAADTSTDTVSVVSRGRERRAGAPPPAPPDPAAERICRSASLFPGGH